MAETVAKSPIPSNQEQVKVESGKRRAEGWAQLPDKVHTWPYLVRAEFIAGSVMLLGLLIWSLGIDAPLEEPANPTKTPNPSKAPWYFLGLQEMLVYFDPWFAGVVAPSLIITGLMVIPYVDVNPNGNGYYTFRERKFSISVFLFGFLGLWIGQIFIGVFLRGPGWNWFAPWQYWDPHKVVSLTNVDLPYLIGGFVPAALRPYFRSYTGQMIVGFILVGAFFAAVPAFWQFAKKKNYPWVKQLGPVRYYVVALHVWPMVGIVVKMLLRWFLNVKYVLVTPFINF
jgi:Cytochrome b(C-terminal)/b6/petD